MKCDKCILECSFPDFLCNVFDIKDMKVVNLHEDKIIGLTATVMENVPMFHYFPQSTIVNVWLAGCPLDCSPCIREVVKTKISDLRLVEFDGEVLNIITRRRPLMVMFNGGETLLHWNWLKKYIVLLKEHFRIGLKTVGLVGENAINDLIESKLVDVALYEIPCIEIKYFKKHMAHSLKKLVDSAIHVETMIPLTRREVSEDAIVGNVEAILGSMKHIPIIIYNPSLNFVVARTLWRKLREKGYTNVYVWGDPDLKYSSTYCPSCRNIIVLREGLNVYKVHVVSRKCQFCGYSIYIEEDLHSRRCRPHLYKLLEEPLI